MIWTRVVTKEVMRNDWILDIAELTAFARDCLLGVRESTVKNASKLSHLNKWKNLLRIHLLRCATYFISELQFPTCEMETFIPAFSTL